MNKNLFDEQTINICSNEHFLDYIIVQFYINVSLINHTDLLVVDSSYFGDDLIF